MRLRASGSNRSSGDSKLTESEPPQQQQQQQATDELVTSEVDAGFFAQLLAAEDCSLPDMSDSGAEDTDEQGGGELRDISYSRLVKRELELVIKLRRLAEGKLIEVPDGADGDSSGRAVAEGQAEAPVSQETQEMQRLRRERNRRAAIDCRRKRRNREKKLTEKLQQLKSEIAGLSERASRFERLYRDSLRSMPTQGDFQNYLKRNPELVRDPLVKPVLRAFVSEDYPKLPQYVMMALVPATSVQSAP